MPELLHEFYVFEKAGIRIGIIGLVEKSVPPRSHETELIFVTENGSALSQHGL